MSYSNDYKEVIQREKLLLEGHVRSSEIEIRKYIAEEFFEFGSSGIEFRFDDLFPALQNDTETVPFELIVVEIKNLSEKVILLTYRLTRGGIKTLRSSIWENKQDVGWQMIFHQGTKSAK